LKLIKKIIMNKKSNKYKKNPYDEGQKIKL
jgi:hypothetical protein